MTIDFDAIDEGQAIPTIRRSPTTTHLVKYAAVAEDFARQHWDQPYMASLGFPNVIVHGWLTLSYMCQAVTEWLPPDVARIARYDARHRRPAFPGDMILGGRVTRKAIEQDERRIDLDLWARDADGETLTSGTMTLVML